MRVRGDHVAFGAPGIEPRWTQANKEGVGTYPYSESKVWFTLWRGVLTEIYYPLVDHPQIRDLQYLVSDGRTFFHEEKRHLSAVTHRLGDHTLGYRVNSSDPHDRYRIEKQVITDVDLPVVLAHTRFVHGLGGPVDPSLYVLLAPHLDVAGWGNDAYVIQLPGREILAAQRNGTWLALGATRPFRRLSCGYVGASDGWTDLSENYLMDYEFDRAPDGNVALTGEIDVGLGEEFTLAVAFGQGLPNAVTALMQSLSVPFEEHLKKFRDGWNQVARGWRVLDAASGDHGNLYHASTPLMVAHEDKTFRGARIASLSIPWGHAHGDDDRGGYHLVWTRDLVQSAIGLLAAGSRGRSLRSLIYLAGIQQSDGGFPQNSWLNAEPYYGSVQLDEVAFPILLAGLLKREKALADFDPWPMVRAAARFLVIRGPATEQERWEEASGYSPSTLASNIAALIVAAGFARERSDEESARFLEQYADFLSDHVEEWTVTTRGSLVPGIPRHFVRIRPADPSNAYVEGPADSGELAIRNLEPGEPSVFPVPDVVDAGFLELVRYGVRSPHDPTIVRSLEVVDRVLKVETPFGPVWRRYNHDGYGQRDDGGPFLGSGVGRAWPLLTAERAHYELALGKDVRELVRAIERFASPTGLLPEQVWDAPDRPDLHLHLGRPTTSAMPLVWAHAEYVKLLRSIEDRKVFAQFPEVEERYWAGRRPRCPFSLWKANWRPPHVAAGPVLRIVAAEPFNLHWSDDGWGRTADTISTPTPIGLHHVEISTADRAGRELRFTFHWVERDEWEGTDYSVRVDAPRPPGST